MRWSRIAATGKAFPTRKRLRACSAAVEPSLIPTSCKHSFPSPSRKPPTSLPLPEQVCRQRCRRRFVLCPWQPILQCLTKRLNRGRLAKLTDLLLRQQVNLQIQVVPTLPAAHHAVLTHEDEAGENDCLHGNNHSE